MLLSSSYEVLIGCMFALGAMATIRVQVATAYFFELFSRNQQKSVFTALASIGNCGSILIGLYFRYVSQSAYGLLHIAYGMIIAGTLAQMFYPEAPRYLVKRDKWDQAVKTVQHIAASNSKRLDASFIESMLTIEDNLEENEVLDRPRMFLDSDGEEKEPLISEKSSTGEEIEPMPKVTEFLQAPGIL